MELASPYAFQYHLDVALVCAVVEQESAWDRWGIRYEPAFYSRYVLPLGLKSQTEARARSISWGPMQVMGQVAREFGYRATYLSQLCEWDDGLDIGCKVLSHKIAVAGGDVRKGLLRYNGGGNPRYPDEVLGRMWKYRP